MKECFKCKKVLEDKDFWKGCAYCIQCDKDYRKEWRAKNKEKYAERRKYLWREKYNRICKNCGIGYVGKGRKREYCSTKCRLLHCVEKINGCWNWLGDIHPNGYGYATCHETNRTMHAHRLSYKIFKGEIPEGLYVCHHCDNPACINPDHLWIGTAKENMQDAKNKGRLRNQYTRKKNAERKMDPGGPIEKR